MPILYRGALKYIPAPVSKMTMPQLIDYEKSLWRWMKHSPPLIVGELNAIYREVEWRAQEREWNAAHPAEKRP